MLSDPTWQQHWHPIAQSLWLFHPVDRVFVSYEDPKSIGLRAQLATDRGLRGVIMWELTSDANQHSLLQAMVRPFE